MPSWIGPWEIAIVLVLALLIFGPKKLPDLGASLGRSISGFKKGLKESQEEIRTAIKEDVTVDKEAALAPAESASKAEAGAAAAPKTDPGEQSAAAKASSLDQG
jgi:sec-independent protein translocase protein TatA